MPLAGLQVMGMADAPLPSTDERPEPTLANLVRAVALRASDAQAALVCGIGLALGTAILFLWLAWWHAGTLLLAVGAFGGAIVADRMPPSTGARTLKAGALVVAGASLFALGLAVLTRTLGIWIS
jgi:hypothetical protein